MAEPLQLDWSQAAVKDATLTVSLTGSPPKKWRASFETAGVLLGRDRLVVSLSKQGVVEVSQVESGDEDAIREFVEACVLQANATIVDEDELFGTGSDAPDDEADQPAGDDEPAQATHDEELTDRFRAFADGDAAPQ